MSCPILPVFIDGRIWLHTETLEYIEKLYPLSKHFKLEKHHPKLSSIDYSWDTVSTLHAIFGMNSQIYQSIPTPCALARQQGSWAFVGPDKPMKHQEITTDYITLYDDIFIFNDPGTGKTRCVIWAIDYLLKVGKIKKALIASPISVQPEWAREFFLAAPHIRIANLFGDKQAKLKALQIDAQVHIINHHGLAVLKDKLIAEKYDMLVIDEATRNFKSTRTNIYKAVTAIRKSKPMRTVIMTGTPMANSLLDAYPLLHMMYPNLSVARNKATFLNTFMYKQGPFKWVPKPKAIEEVKKFMFPAVRFAAEDCIDLPEITYVNRHAELTKEQRVYFNEMVDQLQIECDGKVAKATTSAVRATKLLQILAGAVRSSTGSNDPITILPEPRLNAVLEIVGDVQGQVLIFAPFVATIPLLVQALHSSGYEVASVYGATSAGERARIFNEFRGGMYKALVCHPDVASHGLTLVNAKATIWYSPVYNQETYAQANKRMHRKGQVDKTVVYNVGCHPLEWRVYDALKKKEAAQRELFDLFDNFSEVI
jgi:SNF2 family DNA or RNA helicase